MVSSSQKIIRNKWLSIIVVLIIALAVPILSVLGLWFGTPTEPITYSEPPEFVVARITPSAETETTAQSNPNENFTSTLAAADEEFGPVTEESIYKAAYHAIAEAGSPEPWLTLLRHPDQKVRFTAINGLIKASWDAPGVLLPENAEAQIYNTIDDDRPLFLQVQEAFWDRVDTHLGDIQSVMYEMIVDSVENDCNQREVLHVITRMPNSNDDTLKLLNWAAGTHPDRDMRYAAMWVTFFADPNSDTSTAMLRQRSRDPDFKIRSQSSFFRLEQFIGYR